MADQTRRSSRVRKEVPILLVGSDMEGRVFSERTKTVVLSRHGAGLISEYTLSAEQEVIIRLQDSDREAEVRVVGQLAMVDGRYIYGVAFLDPHLNFWDIEFPQMTDSEKEAAHKLLECSSCKVRETVDQSDVESDVFTINQGVVRYCKKCGSSTMWKLATGKAAADTAAPVRERRPAPQLAASPDAEVQDTRQLAELEPIAPVPIGRPSAAPPTLPARPQPAPPPAASATGGRRENRRKHVRTKVNFKACVRYQGSEDIVTCEDISRGGVRLKSRKRYSEKAMIEVAVPYSPGTPSVFVPAQIVYAQELPSENLYRYGVAYLTSGRG